MRIVTLGLLLAAGFECGPQPMTTPPPKPPTAKPPAPTPATAPANPIVAVASQSFHTCALRQAGQVLCWGRNTYGQLGDGTRTNSDRMVAVAGLQDATQVVTGRDFSCALRKTGSVVCWGNNEDGQLGDGRGAKVGAKSPRPVKVAKLGRVAQLVSGDWHVCARETSGAVQCWGNGENGQIGSDANRAFATPVAIEQLGKTTELASGANHVCARQADGRVKCWGRNSEGQLGDGKSGSRIKPVFVSGIAGATGLWSGHTFSCAATERGAVRCWGDNKKAQLGPSAGRDPKWNAPIPFKELDGAAQVVGGETHGCARMSTGRVLCWGGNEGGRAVGKGNGVIGKPTPVRGVSDAIALTAGVGHTCAVGRSGKVSCWGQSVDDAVGRYRLAQASGPRLGL
ncbi:MAG: hypothetical protein AAF721_33265 [Myxococcota bacterium]